MNESNSFAEDLEDLIDEAIEGGATLHDIISALELKLTGLKEEQGG